MEKAALTRAKLWLNTVFGTHTPWGGHDQVPVVAPPETELERALSEEIMQSGNAQPSGISARGRHCSSRRKRERR